MHETFLYDEELSSQNTSIVSLLRNTAGVECAILCPSFSLLLPSILVMSPDSYLPLGLYISCLQTFEIDLLDGRGKKDHEPWRQKDPDKRSVSTTPAVETWAELTVLGHQTPPLHNESHNIYVIRWLSVTAIWHNSWNCATWPSGEN